MSWIIIWLFMSVEKIAAALAVGSTVLYIAIAVFVLTYVVAFLGSKDESTWNNILLKTKKYRRVAIVAGLVGILMSSTSIMMPNKKELAIIIAVGGTWEVLNSEPAKELGGKALELIRQELENALEESKGVLKENVKNSISEQVKGASL